MQIKDRRQDSSQSEEWTPSDTKIKLLTFKKTVLVKMPESLNAYRGRELGF